MAGPGRYARHRELFSEASWERLCSTRFELAGVGGLGSTVATLLARLGPVHLELWDPGVLDEPDLNRQLLYRPSDLGRPKVEAAEEAIAAMNPEVRVIVHKQAISAETWQAVHQLQDDTGIDRVLIDCLDSFAARAELDQIQALDSVPLIHAGVERWYGQVCTLIPGERSLRDLYGDQLSKLPKAEKPILPSVVTTLASLQVTEIVHWCEAGHPPHADSLLIYDGTLSTFDEISLGDPHGGGEARRSPRGS